MGLINEKLLRMLHGSRGAVFSKRAPLVAEGKNQNRIKHEKGNKFCFKWF